jgi:hypothetical protein
MAKITKTKAAQAYRNPGSRNSLLGGRVPARYSVMANGIEVARIFQVADMGWTLWDVAADRQVFNGMKFSKVKEEALSRY